MTFIWCGGIYPAADGKPLNLFKKMNMDRLAKMLNQLSSFSLCISMIKKIYKKKKKKITQLTLFKAKMLTEGIKKNKYVSWGREMRKMRKNNYRQTHL